MFNLFKNKITPAELAGIMYHGTITNHIKNDLKDSEGNTLLTKEEQMLMLAQHMYYLLENYGLKKVKEYFLMMNLTNNQNIKGSTDLEVQQYIFLGTIEKIKDFFEKFTSLDDPAFSKQEFLFNKNINHLQKILVMEWYISHCKTIDNTFKSMLKKVKLVDDK